MVGDQMLLTPTELERLTIYTAAELARKRRAKGLKLNHPEATAIIADEILEGAREGRSVADLIAFGSTILDQRRRDAGRRAAHAGAAGRGHVPGRHQAGDGARADPPGQAAGGREGRHAGRDHRGRRRHRDQRRAAQSDRQGAQHRRPPDPGRQPLPLLRGEQGAGVRARESVRHASRHSCRHRGALRARRGQGGDAGRVRRHRRDLRPEQPDQRLDAQRRRKRRRCGRRGSRVQGG